jgi:hypothetical protein
MTRIGTKENLRSKRDGGGIGNRKISLEKKVKQ